MNFCLLQFFRFFKGGYCELCNWDGIEIISFIQMIITSASDPAIRLESTSEAIFSIIWLFIDVSDQSDDFLVFRHASPHKWISVLSSLIGLLVLH